MKLAFTLDDAPTIVEPGIPGLPGIMDTVRERLQSAHVAHCVAFVVGERAVAHEDSLRRWLDAGYQLGNHTHFHRPAHQVGLAETIESIELCDHLLERIGAFDRGPKWFRFPHLNRGKDVEARSAIKNAYTKLGYQLASASVNFDDDRFERAWLAAQDDELRQQIQDRYVGSVLQAVRHADRTCRNPSSLLPQGQIGYAHFSSISCATLPRLIERLRASGCCLVALEEIAMEEPFKSYNSDLSFNGLVSDAFGRRTILERVLRRVVPLSQRLDLFEQNKKGPLWPYLN